MINTGVEINILFEKLSRNISKIVYNTTDYQIFTITRIEFGFIEIVKLRAEITDGIGYKDIFFLIKGALKILFS
jgi:hypothetical protein